jgi:hypothetical protein
VVDGFWRQQRITEHGIGNGNDKGGQEQCVVVLEVAGCSLWQRGRMANSEAVGGGIDILPSFFMGMCGCKAGVIVFTQELLLNIFILNNTQDQSVLTEDKHFHVCRLFMFRLQLTTILVGM